MADKKEVRKQKCICRPVRVDQEHHSGDVVQKKKKKNAEKWGVEVQRRRGEEEDGTTKAFMSWAQTKASTGNNIAPEELKVEKESELKEATDGGETVQGTGLLGYHEK